MWPILYNILVYDMFTYRARNGLAYKIINIKGILAL